MSVELPYAWGGPVATGVIKQSPDDFYVDELLGFEPSGSGEHVFLHIEKTGENTEYVAKSLAKFAGLAKNAVSYAGLKDRHGRTRQWFSVHMPGKTELDWHSLDSDSLKILKAMRHDKKLKKGALKGNHFEIVVRDLKGCAETIEDRLQCIAANGVPNYFGSQRMGLEGQNLIKAQALFDGKIKVKDRYLKGIYLSAVRSELFNRILARRVSEGNWNVAISGDVYMFTGSHGFFKAELSPEIMDRIKALEIHPSAPLWGVGESPATEQMLQIENEVCGEYASWCDGLTLAGLEMARRSLRLIAQDLSWHFIDSETLQLSFNLPAGHYATTLLRELIQSDGE